MFGTLYIVATPIGNLHDFSPRAIATLSDVGFVLAEDTRVARKLLEHFAIHAPVLRLDAHAGALEISKNIERLKKGVSLALITDAGTPAISDPGSWFIAEAVRVLGSDLKVVPVPGPSAVTAALSISGFHTDIFTFYGFLPPKKGRATRVKEICATPHTVIFFESPHRIEKTLLDLCALCPERRAVVCRELTKMFETVERGTLKELSVDGRIRAQGEFVIVLAPLN